MEDNWIISNLEYALNVWNNKLAEIWTLLTETPQHFKGGEIWNVILSINEVLQATGYGLVILFFLVGFFKTSVDFKEFQRPEFAVRYLLKFILAKFAVTYCMRIMTTIFTICSGIVTQMATHIGILNQTTAILPDEIKTAINNTGFLASIPLWLVTLLGSLFILIMSFILILTAYGRFFRLYMYTAIAPIPLASFAGEGTSSIGKSFIKSYIGVCMEGTIIVLACLIFSAFSNSPPTVDTSTSVVTMVWKYIGELIFNMLVLVGLVKASDRITKEMLGL